MRPVTGSDQFTGCLGHAQLSPVDWWEPGNEWCKRLTTAIGAAGSVASDPDDFAGGEQQCLTRVEARFVGDGFE
jgi:hypothetical protein